MKFCGIENCVSFIWGQIPKRILSIKEKLINGNSTPEMLTAESVIIRPMQDIPKDYIPPDYMPLSERFNFEGMGNLPMNNSINNLIDINESVIDGSVIDGPVIDGPVINNLEYSNTSESVDMIKILEMLKSTIS